MVAIMKMLLPVLSTIFRCHILERKLTGITNCECYYFSKQLVKS
eukprot:UN11461